MQAHEHPDANKLSAFIEGALEPDARAAVERHLDQCATCYETVTFAMRALDDGHPDNQFATAKKLGVKPFIAIAAAAMLLLAVGLFWSSMNKSKLEPVTVLAEADVLLGRWQHYDWGIDLPSELVANQMRGGSDQSVSLLNKSLSSSDLAPNLKQVVAYALTDQTALARLVLENQKESIDLDQTNIVWLLRVIEKDDQATRLKAIEALTAALEDHTEHSTTLFNLAVLHAETGSQADAMGFAEGFWALDDSSAKAQLLRRLLNSNQN